MSVCVCGSWLFSYLSLSLSLSLSRHSLVVFVFTLFQLADKTEAGTVFLVPVDHTESDSLHIQVVTASEVVQSLILCPSNSVLSWPR